MSSSNRAAVEVTYNQRAIHQGFLNSDACDLCGALVVDASSLADYSDGVGRKAAPQTNHEKHTAFHERLGF